MKGGEGFIGVQRSGLPASELEIYIVCPLVNQKHGWDLVAWEEASCIVFSAQQAPAWPPAIPLAGRQPHWQHLPASGRYLLNFSLSRMVLTTALYPVCVSYKGVAPPKERGFEPGFGCLTPSLFGM